jgi:hypothetical protein
MGKFIAALVILAACSKKDDCEKLFDKMASVMPDEVKDKASKNRDKELAKCREHLDEMKKDPMVKCMLDASGDDEVKKCLGDSFGDSQKKSKKSEAALMLNKIGKNAKRVFGETGSFPTASGALLPAGGGGDVGKNCCGGKGGTKASPGTTVNNKCTADPAAFTKDPGWTALEFSVDEASMYQYSFVGGAKEFTAYAIGDIDCDGQSATFTLHGTVTSAGNPQIDLTPPPAGVY